MRVTFHLRKKSRFHSLAIVASITTFLDPGVSNSFVSLLMKSPAESERWIETFSLKQLFTPGGTIDMAHGHVLKDILRFYWALRRGITYWYGFENEYKLRFCCNK